MKNSILIIFFIPFIFYGQLSNNDIFTIKSVSKKDSLDIINVMQLQENAWNNGDIDLFMNGYIKSEDLVFSGKSGPVYGWKNTRDRYLKNYPNIQAMGQLKFSVSNIKLVSSDIAFLIGEYYLKRNTEDSSGHFTLFWKKVNNEWLIISDHTTAVK